jgi:hypothetical protein
VSTRVHSWVEGEKHDMVVGKGEEGNKKTLHISGDIGVYST